MSIISGFSKLDKSGKINWIADTFFDSKQEVAQTLKQYWNEDLDLQNLHDDFIENAISNYYLPLGVAPNFRINDKVYAVPMVTEESSVVAAASLVAKLWKDLGGFKTEVLGTEKIGQIHLNFNGDFKDLKDHFDKVYDQFFEVTDSLTQNMRKRGGGIDTISLVDKTGDLDNYYQIHVTFDTKDSMGANFINSCLESMAKVIETEKIEVIMSILSNYLPNCTVKAELSCEIKDLPVDNPELFARKFQEAVKIAEIEPFRAVTHNKGIMNGIDSVVVATGNDFRAIEAGAHAYAARNGKYSSLSSCSLDNGYFSFSLTVPLALGTVGGLTALHPMAQFSMDLLGRPNAEELMQIVAAVGLAQNFAALRALVTSGIQKGHMKMHLSNILNQEGVIGNKRKEVEDYFQNRTISHKAVLSYLKMDI